MLRYKKFGKSYEEQQLSTEELMLLNCGAVENSLEILGQQRDQTSQS